MVPSALPTLLLLSSAAAMRIATPRASIRMGLSSGAQFPQDALDKFGVAGKKAVLFFYGADDAPSCSKQIKSFGESLSKFEAAGVEVMSPADAVWCAALWDVAATSARSEGLAAVHPVLAFSKCMLSLVMLGLFARLIILWQRLHVTIHSLLDSLNTCVMLS